MNYQQTLDYLFSQLPMFQRIGAAAYKADLNNTIAICSLLNNPENQFRSIHVAGTNGKGSTSHMLASILQEAGMKVGLYTSPHLKDFRERIKINGEMIPEKNVVDFVAKYKDDFGKIQPSFFEMTVGLAFDYFANEKVDIAVIEVGLGGRLDSTNVIKPLLSIITNISLDHTALLGNTLEKIAGEKAGIIKNGSPVVIGESIAETRNVFIDKSASEHTSIVFAEEIYQAENVKQVEEEQLYLSLDVKRNGKPVFEKIESELPGLYQKKNIITVLTSVDVLNQLGFSLSEGVVREGIKKVIRNTGLLGRWQVLQKAPLVIADTGHNEAGIKEVVAQISLVSHDQLHFVLGMVNDKDISTILKMLPAKAIYYFCKAKIPRALDATELAYSAGVYGLQGDVCNSVADALNAAKNKARSNDLIFVGGSTFTVAEVV
ncbi:MAG: folylpolyglutamate synthase/dihydrofolate synthase [Bacteroidetes bacterium]|jgi:dihydrofolate synthase/folylpolyglutamate synthase|nr:folylpolyglutamate synthase/dihydrofolate synthase [Bacteroidota bacterium]